jgi:hypothetical protein
MITMRLILVTFVVVVITSWLRNDDDSSSSAHIFVAEAANDVTSKLQIHVRFVCCFFLICFRFRLVLD